MILRARDRRRHVRGRGRRRSSTSRRRRRSSPFRTSASTPPRRRVVLSFSESMHVEIEAQGPRARDLPRLHDDGVPRRRGRAQEPPDAFPSRWIPRASSRLALRGLARGRAVVIPGVHEQVPGAPVEDLSAAARAVDRLEAVRAAELGAQAGRAQRDRRLAGAAASEASRAPSTASDRSRAVHSHRSLRAPAAMPTIPTSEASLARPGSRPRARHAGRRPDHVPRARVERLRPDREPPDALPARRRTCPAPRAGGRFCACPGSRQFTPSMQPRRSRTASP